MKKMPLSLRWRSSMTRSLVACGLIFELGSARAQIPAEASRVPTDAAPAVLEQRADPPPVEPRARPLAPKVPAEGAISPRRREARKRFARGTALANEGYLEAALVEFQAAYSLLPRSEALFNIGFLQLELERLAEARQSFERYLREASGSEPPDVVMQVRTKLEGLRTGTARVMLRSSQLPVDVQVDSRILPPLALEPTAAGEGITIFVDAGRRHLRVSKPGYRSYERILTVQGGSDLELLVDLSPPPLPSPPAPVLAVPVDSPTSLDAPQWVAWGVTGALALGFVASAVLAARAQATKNRRERSLSTSQEKVEEAMSRLRTQAIVTDVLLGATLVGAGTSLYMTYSSSAPSQAQSVTPSGRLARTARQLQLHVGGTF